MAETHYWRTKSGELIALSEMTTEHIQRCYKYLPDYSQWRDRFDAELLRRERHIDVEVNNDSPVRVSIGLSRMPKHCGECPLYLNNEHFDEDGFFGDCISRSCPFGASLFGCLVERPKDCPLTESK